MDLNEKYFSANTRGFKILNRFYLKYHDLFAKTLFTEFEGFRNQIFLNISGIKFPDYLKNEEAYLIGALKIQCRVLLDKALRYKSEKSGDQLNNASQIINEEGISITEQLSAALPVPHEIPEGEQVLNSINIFKLRLNYEEKELFNSMIDGKSSTEIISEKNPNTNNVDINISKLRIKFFTFLKENGLDYQMFKNFEKPE